MEQITVLGATGSIGVSTLDVVAQHSERFGVFALTARHNVGRMLEQIVAFNPRYAVMQDESSAQELRRRLPPGSTTEVLEGDGALIDVASASEVTTVVAAIVGAAGLAPTMAAVRQGKKVLLANKESLVMAGALFMRAVHAAGAQLLPVDSEHNAIFQCLPVGQPQLAAAGVRRLLLTGSGGPFRETPLAELEGVSPHQACAHPNWSMGPKISVDSATMMNKGLEFIEACWLFDARPEQIQVVVHPQSIVHSMVEYIDGSVLAQLGQPDMRTPIAHCLAWPERITNSVPSLDFFQLGRLDFAAPDLDRFPCLRLAIEAMKVGGTCPAALNAANEVAVESFLSNRIRFIDIAQVVDQVMQSWSVTEPDALDAVLDADQKARATAWAHVGKLQSIKTMSG